MLENNLFIVVWYEFGVLFRGLSLVKFCLMEELILLSIFWFVFGVLKMNKRFEFEVILRDEGVKIGKMKEGKEKFIVF